MAESLTWIGDPKFYYENKSAESAGPADVKLSGATLYRDPGLENAVLISIGSNARADDHDELPQGETSRGGWWGTALDPAYQLSKRWLLSRSKLDMTTLRLLEQYDKDSLAWMTDPSVRLAESIEATAVRDGLNKVNSLIVIRRADYDVKFKYYINWESQMIGGLQ